MRFVALVSVASILGSARATWCHLWYDGDCTDNANGGTSFDCDNNEIFGSGGGFVNCHATSGNSQPCYVYRDDQNGNTLYSTVVNADSSCHNMYGAGPYYSLAFGPTEKA